MRRLLLSSAALAVMSAGAFAADLPARGPAIAPAPVYVAPIFTWSGFYVGLNAGVGFGNNDNRGLRAFAAPGAPGPVLDAVDFVNAGFATARRDSDRTSFTGGAQIGYNWQFGAMVFGLEADINYMDRKRGGGNYTLVGTGRYAGYELDVNHGRGGSNWFGTIRPRLGVAFDRTMIYATGGLAYGGSRGDGATVTLFDTAPPPAVEVARWAGNRRSGSNWGWTIGGGVEHAFGNNWSAKLEYLYVDLDRGGNRDLVRISGDQRADLVSFRAGRSSSAFHVVRAGLNWRFGGPAYSAGGPVVAAY
jgi:outer membrane immunogenic protein